MVALIVSGEESVSTLDNQGSCTKLPTDDIFFYSHSEFPPLSRMRLPECNPGKTEQRPKVKAKATCDENNNDGASGGKESFEKKKEAKHALRKRLRPADDLWCFKFTEVWENAQLSPSICPENRQDGRCFDWEDLLTFEFEDTFVYARKFKIVSHSLEKISKRQSATLLRDKCLPERSIPKIQRKGKKLFAKSDISTRRRYRYRNISENNLGQKQNTEKSLKKRGIKRDRENVQVQLDLDALNSAMPTTLAQQRKLRMSKVVVPSGPKTENESAKASTRKQRNKPRWKDVGHYSKNQQTQKFELHATNLGYVDTSTNDDVLWQLINIQHRELTPEDYDLLLRLDEQVAPKTVNKDMLSSMKVVTIDVNKMAELGDGVCSVCMEGYSVDQKLKYLPCDHFYHEPCIDNWLLNCDTKCPLDGMEVS
ncbi:hypothetical protein HOLleu_15907 [Holothuria leucospilota]|uniref:RING-type domain-containing protein n=1 Tax=Holothuria leucospilota TaxID=206669 RepID=A0A9Q1C4U5_HOLLE|nr:hypothetical protein HOLleu_15907 [Holothuria leucospilota]